MTSNDEWSALANDPEAKAVVETWLSGFGEFPLQLTQLQKDWLVIGIASAFDRGKAEQDKAVAAWRAHSTDCFARAEAAEAKLARLDNPDEALVEAVFNATTSDGVYSWQLRKIFRASYRTLSEGKENSDVPKT